MEREPALSHEDSGARKPGLRYYDDHQTQAHQLPLPEWAASMNLYQSTSLQLESLLIFLTLPC